jgi:hypothetical protein
MNGTLNNDEIFNETTTLRFSTIQNNAHSNL